MYTHTYGLFRLSSFPMYICIHTYIHTYIHTKKTHSHTYATTDKQKTYVAYADSRDYEEKLRGHSFMVLQTVGQAVAGLTNMDTLMPWLHAIGSRHAKYVFCMYLSIQTIKLCMHACVYVLASARAMQGMCYAYIYLSMHACFLYWHRLTPCAVCVCVCVCLQCIRLHARMYTCNLASSSHERYADVL